MKKFTKITCLVFALVFCAMGMISCGTSEGFVENTYKIGATGPLTGDNSSYGISVKEGAQIAIDEINANGGLNGVKFSFEMIDDVAAADKAATGYTTLFEKGMQVSIGSVTSGAAKSFGEAAKEDNVLFMTPSASAADVIATGAHGFRVCFGDPQQGTIAADELVKNYSKIGVIYDTSDTYSSGIYEAFEAQMTKLNKTKGTDYIVKTFNKENNKDFSTQVGDLKAAACDVLFLPFYYTEAGLVAKKAAQEGFNVPIFGCDGLDGIADQLDDSVTAEIKYITPFDVNSDDADVKKFVEAYKAKYNKTPDQFAADGYDAVMIIFEAMKAAKVDNVNITASELTELLKPILTGGEFKYSGVTGKNMIWTAEGSCEKEANIVTLDR
ncbi:MAG: ABC transporter substrate-binding protein [Clostridia bacterium]|nr:ABC transporter substrate-binding protein [Clostridia bacterium]